MKKRILSMALAAALTFGASQQAMAQTPVQQGVRAGNNTTTVNGTAVTTAGQVVSAGRGTTVTVTTATPPAGKVAKVTVTKKEDFTATTATITGSETVNKNGTTTLTATVTPSFANTVVWTVTAGTGSAEFVTGETTTAATVTSVVDPETGQAAATLKGLEPGEVTVTVAATTSTTGTPISAEAKTLTVLNPATATAPTLVNKVVKSTIMALCSAAGTAENGTMKYAVSTSNTTAPTSGWSTSLPKASSINSTGHYYVWYYAEANEGYADSEKQVTENYVDVVNGASEKLTNYQHFVNATNNTTTGTNFTLTGTISDFNCYKITKDISFNITRRNSETIYRVDVKWGHYSTQYYPTFDPTCNYNSSNDNGYITNNSTGIIGPSLSMRVNTTSNTFYLIEEVVIYYY